MGPVHPVAVSQRSAPRRPPRPRRVARSRVPWHRRLRRDRAAIRYWLVVAALAWVLASTVGHTVSRADEARRHWGRTTRVWVTTQPLRAGERIDGAVRAERWPTALVSPAAVTTVAPAARAAAALDPGTALTKTAVDETGRGGTERRTVAITLPEGRLPVVDGDRVDVWATTDPAVDSGGREPARARRVATDAQVVSISRSSVVLAVLPAQVPALAEAAATATVTLVGGR